MPPIIIMNFDQYMNQLRERSPSERAKGAGFERGMSIALNEAPLYRSRFSEIVMWEDWSLRATQDLGIDLVATLRPEEGGGHCAIQCKFYGDTTHLAKSNIDSFLSQSSQKYKNHDGQLVPWKERIIITTKDDWSPNAERAIRNQDPPVTRIGLSDIRQWNIDWQKILVGKPPDISARKEPYPHQREAIEKVTAAFNDGAERGKLIMACGTGKTYTALKISERLVKPGESMLFLVPSLGLMSQSLKDFSRDVSAGSVRHRYLAVCSDKQVGKELKTSQEDSIDAAQVDLPIPPTTQAHEVAAQLSRQPKDKPLVIFSTYHSIDVIAQAQRAQPNHSFKLIICDEAHRTAGFVSDDTRPDQEQSAFTRIHNSGDIRGQHRLYMTATPKVYSARSKKKVEERGQGLLCSMEDPSLYGETLYEYGFSRAIQDNQLSDYVVHIFAMHRTQYEDAARKVLRDPKITLEDALKVIGCCKTFCAPSTLNNQKGKPLKRVVAFTNTIKHSKIIRDVFNNINSQQIVQESLAIQADAEHVDGTMGAMERSRHLNWLSDEIEDKHCRILSNARCLNRGHRCARP